MSKGSIERMLLSIEEDDDVQSANIKNSQQGEKYDDVNNSRVLP